MVKSKIEYPWRKVIYSRLKSGTKGMYFILLECGHVFHHGYILKVPKRKQCCYCVWKTKTIDLLFWDHDATRWAFLKSPDTIGEFMNKIEFTKYFVDKDLKYQE